MATKRPLSFGIKTAPQHTTYEEMLVVWREADALSANRRAGHMSLSAGEGRGSDREARLVELMVAFAELDGDRNWS
jgi:hypothetical protein